MKTLIGITKYILHQMRL